MDDRGSRANKNCFQKMFEQVFATQPGNKRTKNKNIFNYVQSNFCPDGIKSCSSSHVCAQETSKLDPYASKKKRLWTSWAVVVDHPGAQISPTVIVAPYPGNAIVSTKKYAALSLQSFAEIMNDNISAKIRQNRWNEIFLPVSEKESCAEAVSSGNIVQGPFARPFLKK